MEAAAFIHMNVYWANWSAAEIYETNRNKVEIRLAKSRREFHTVGNSVQSDAG
jgi:hypothetical protein